MLIEYMAHSCFYLQTKGGKSLVIDPCDPGIGYRPVNRSCDLIIVSHDHRGHNFIEGIRGKAGVMMGSLQPRRLDDVTVRNVLADHDASGGEKLGKTMITLVEADGMRLCHLGDLGQILSDEQVGEIGKVDILCVPVGGHSTIDGKQAQQVVARLAPRLVIPMHYLTGNLNREEYPLQGVDLFLEKQLGVSRSYESRLEITPDTLPEKQEIRVLNFTN